MGEEGRIEVAAHLPLPAEIHPRRKMFWLEPVAVNPAAVRFVHDRIARMKIHFDSAGDKASHLVDITHQLFRRACASRIVSGRLNAAREGFVRVCVKAADIISLPAVQG